MTDRIWTEEEKEQWLAQHGRTPTHVVTFEPLYQLEVCIPPWEHPDRQIARSAVSWGRSIGTVLEGEGFGSASVVAAHHEGSAYTAASHVTA